MYLFGKLVTQFFLDIFYFPLWWYSVGVKNMARVCLGLVDDGNANLAPGLWLKNIFVPMFGQRDWQGRIMSFFMRLVNVIARGFGLGIWIFLVFLFFLLWIVLPLFVLYFLLHSLLSL